jgi:hypothetical protein
MLQNFLVLLTMGDGKSFFVELGFAILAEPGIAFPTGKLEDLVPVTVSPGRPWRAR